MGKLLAGRLTWRWTTLVGGESVLIVGTVMAAVYMRAGGWTGADGGAVLGKALLAAFICQACLYYRDLYDYRPPANRRELLRRVLQALGVASLIFAIAALWAPALIVAGTFPLAVLLFLLVITAWRFTFGWFARRVPPRERLLVVGTSAAAVGLARELQARTEQGIEIVGFIEPEPGEPAPEGADVIGTIEDIPAIVRARGVARVVVHVADARGKLPMSTLLDMKLGGIAFDHLASVYEEYMGRIAVENLRPSWLIFSEGFRKSRILSVSKRAVDVLGAGVGLVLTLPLMLIIALAVRLTSPGPVLYRQKRVGQFGRVFTLRKFRSMRRDAEAGTGAVWADRNDARVTPLGRLLRKSHLDELPQLWNIFVGDMSLIGPRPERPEFVSGLSKTIAFYGQRHIVRPGLTGWAQVCQAYGASVDESMEKLQYDLFYIKNMSFTLDAYIVFRTTKMVLQGKGV